MKTKDYNPHCHEEAVDDDIESLIPAKYRDLDTSQFEKFTKRNDWD